MRQVLIINQKIEEAEEIAHNLGETKAEGAKGLYHILNYFSSCSIKWVVVTHLNRLSIMCESDDNISKLHVSKEEKYKIIG